MERSMVLERRYQVLGLFLVMLFLVSGGVFTGRLLKGSEEEPVLAELPLTEPLEEEVAVLMVHIKGAVRCPGVYEFPEGARVRDALAKGEVLPEGNGEALNQAAFLQDEEEIYVPYRQNPESGREMEEELPSDPRVSINRGTQEELEGIPGIGPKLAEAILRQRNKGAFKSLEDLLLVTGIGEKTLENLMPYIRL